MHSQYDKCPHHTKKELVEWASTFFGKPKNRYTHLKKRQLYAMWYKAKPWIQWA